MEVDVETRRGASLVWRQTQEVQICEAREIGIERDEPTPAGDGESGKIRIRPEAMGLRRLRRQRGEVVFEGRWFIQKPMVRARQKLAIDIPRLSSG